MWEEGGGGGRENDRNKGKEGETAGSVSIFLSGIGVKGSKLDLVTQIVK